MRGDRSSLTRKSTGAVRPAELKIARPPPTVRGARQRQVAGREGEGLRARAVMKFAKFAGLVHVVTTLLLPATPLTACNIGAEPSDSTGCVARCSIRLQHGRSLTTTVAVLLHAVRLGCSDSSCAAACCSIRLQHGRSLTVTVAVAVLLHAVRLGCNTGVAVQQQ